MQTVTQNQILAQLIRLNIALSARKAGDELEVAAEVFFEDCHRMSNEDFKAAVARHRRKSVYFPAPADILREYALIITERRNSIQALPPVERLSEEQAAFNLQKIKELRAVLKSM